MPFVTYGKDLPTSVVGIPTKVYLHDAGLDTTFSGNRQEGMRHAAELLGKEKVLFRGSDFILSVVYGLDAKTPVVEAFGYSGVNPWPNNPEVKSWVFQNGIWHQVPESIECEDTVILRGEEAKLRRSSRNMNEYMNRFVRLS